MEARRLGDRLTRLARVTTALVMADSVEAVAKIVVSLGADAAGATLASLTLRESDDRLRLVALRGGREGEDRRWASPRCPPGPRSVTRSGRGNAWSSPERRPSRAATPTWTASRRGQRSLVVLPLRVATRTIGAIGLSFPGVRTLDYAELEFLEILADTCAQALERITAQEAAAEQSAKLAFLAEASTELASSLDYQVTLAKVAQLAVPTFADWCAIDIVEDGRLRRLAVAHVDPAKVELAHELAERYPADPDAPNGPWKVMRTGRSELIAEITDEMLVAGAVDEEHLRIARDLHLRSALTVPLVARGKVLGVITWVSAESERLYTDRRTSRSREDLAKRAAIAIDNAELHSETLAVAVQLQNAVLPEAPARRPRLGGRQLLQPVRAHGGRRRLLRRRPARRRAAGALRRRRHGPRRGRRGRDGPDAGGGAGVRRGGPDARDGDGRARPDVRAVPHRPARHPGLPGRGSGPRRARGDQRRPSTARCCCGADLSTAQLPLAEGAPSAPARGGAGR